MNRSISLRIKSLSVSFQRRSKFGITPSYVVENSRPFPSSTKYFSSPVPYKIMFFASSESSRTGARKSMLCRAATASSLRIYHDSMLMRLNGRIAPSRMVKFGFSASSGSTSKRKPKPLQVGQAPNGALNENRRGSSSGITSSGWSTQAYRCEKTVISSLFPSGFSRNSASKTSKTPPPISSAASTLCATRERISALKTMRSTTISMSCLYFLSISGHSSSE